MPSSTPINHKTHVVAGGQRGVECCDKNHRFGMSLVLSKWLRLPTCILYIFNVFLLIQESIVLYSRIEVFFSLILFDEDYIFTKSVHSIIFSIHLN